MNHFTILNKHRERPATPNNRKIQKCIFLLIILCKLCISQEWQLIGLKNEQVNAVAVNPYNDAIIYAGSTSNYSDGVYGKLFKSSDYGNTWDTLIYNVSVLDIAIHPKKAYIIYLALGCTNFTRPGILKSTDSGETWFWADSGITLNWEVSVATVVPHPDSVDVLYAGTVGIYGGYVHKTTDGGNYWTQYPAEVLHYDFDDIFFDPVEHSTIYAGSGKLFRSVDNGKNWSVVHNWTEVSGGVKLAIDNTNNNILYAGLPGYRLLKSTDYGETWFPSDSGLIDYRFQDLKISKINTNILFSITAEGVIVTTDGANSWKVFNNGFPINLIKRTLELTIDENSLYCGTDSGLYKLSFNTSIKDNNHEYSQKIKLLQNYPNPFNNSTTIPFILSKPGKVKLVIYDISGRIIFTSDWENYSTGYNEKKINLKNIATGLYVYEIQTTQNVFRKKLLFIK